MSFYTNSSEKSCRTTGSVASKRSIRSPNIREEDEKHGAYSYFSVIIEPRERFPETSAFIPDVEDHVTCLTATAGSDVVQSGRPIFDEFSNICGRISATTRRLLSSKWSSVCGLSA
ncbi:hypothetical protein TNCV_2702071 [Trichonephila clavipes]|nr:hypothetical protein TNCV_2702071 [Trichonephila clavipes]